MNRTKHVELRVRHTTRTAEHLLEGLQTKVVEVEEVVQDKDSMEDTSYVVCGKVDVVAVAWEKVEVSSNTAVQKTAVGAHPPDCESVVIEAKCLAVVVAPVKQTAVEVLLV